MKKIGYLAFVLLAELFLLVLLLLLFIFSLIGAFLPFLPGLAALAMALTLYAAMNRFGLVRLTGWSHEPARKYMRRARQLFIFKYIMKIIKKIRRRKARKVADEILKNGMILASLNLCLALIFFLTLSFAHEAMSFLAVSPSSYVLTVLTLLLLAAAACGAAWFRFGQILGEVFSKSQSLHVFLTVLISFVPLFGLIFVVSTLGSVFFHMVDQIFLLFFIALLLVAVYSGILSCLLIILGAVSRK